MMCVDHLLASVFDIIGDTAIAIADAVFLISDSTFILYKFYIGLKSDIKFNSACFERAVPCSCCFRA
jgi:hypothetical protein